MKKRIAVFFFIFAVLLDLAAADHWFSKEFSPVLVNRNGATFNASEVLNGKKVAVYFSASWCGPCRMFTPVLKKFYREVAQKNKFEIVFISSDKNKAAMEQYMQKNSMPWLAVPFDDVKSKNLRRKNRSGGIPKLMVFSEDGKLLSDSARWDVVLLGAKAFDAWSKENYTPRTYQDYRNSRTGGNGNPIKPTSIPAMNIDTSTWIKGPGAQWHIRIDTALAAAKKENKKIFVLTTGSNWCGWCIKLRKEVLDSETFLRYAAENLILVYLDYPTGMKQPEAQKLYNEIIIRPLHIRRGAPAAFILNQDGRWIGSISGYRQLETYMQAIQKIIVKPPSKRSVPAWIKLPPEQLKNHLAAFKLHKQNNANKAKIAAEKFVKQMKFQVTAWGFGPGNINKPFSPAVKIKVPLNKRIYFKVKYQLPPRIRSAIWLRAKTSYCGSGAHMGKGNGEFVALLAAKKPAEEKKFEIFVRLAMPESWQLVAAVLPCNIVWGKEE